MTPKEQIKRLMAFQAAVHKHEDVRLLPDQKRELRSLINQEKTWIRQQVIEARCFYTVTIGPPPAIGGLIMENVDPIQSIFDSPYRLSMVPHVTDMIDQTIGVLKAPPEELKEPSVPMVKENIVKGYAFVAMPMNEDDPEMEDVLDAIKEAASRCGVQAERIDEPETTERITDRIVESIRKAEHVIIDLTHEKPNVYWEAGYAHGIGKVPIYISRHGTPLGFDLKDYPVIFFRSFKQLKDSLEKRIRGLSEKNDGQLSTRPDNE